MTDTGSLKATWLDLNNASVPASNRSRVAVVTAAWTDGRRRDGCRNLSEVASGRSTWSRCTSCVVWWAASRSPPSPSTWRGVAIACTRSSRTGWRLDNSFLPKSTRSAVLGRVNFELFFKLAVLLYLTGCTGTWTQSTGTGTRTPSTVTDTGTGTCNKVLGAKRIFSTPIIMHNPLSGCLKLRNTILYYKKSVSHIFSSRTCTLHIMSLW